MSLEALKASLADRYRIERELGEGGMATVYLAEDLRHRRPVALKVLKPELAAVIGAERFLAEIRTTANLQHPHILALFDSGVAEVAERPALGAQRSTFLYYTMPFIEGESLRDRLHREKQLAIPVAVRIAIEVASALDYAHRHGVIHRDIKPENILLHDGAALVADFGIALAVTSAAGGGNRITETGMSVGTPQYMAPEQALGEREITGRADIYALGAVTYEMLAGEPPFTGPTSQAIITRVMTEEPRPLVHQRRHLSPSVESAVLTALEKLPADRFESAADFAHALESADVDEPVSRSRTGTGRRARRRAMRLHWPVAWAAAAVAMIVLAFMLGAHRGAGSSPIAGFEQSSKVTWTRGLEIGPALSPDGKFVAYAMGGAAGMRIYVRQVSGGRPIGLTDDSLGLQSDPVWSPDGARILFLAEGGIFSAPSSGGPARPELPEPRQGAITSAQWAPDGDRIAFTVADSLYIRNSSGAISPLARIPDASLCRWSPEGNRIACASGNAYYSRAGSYFGNQSPSRIMVVRLKDGETITVTDSIAINQSPAWSPDGHWLYYVSSRLGPRDIYALRLGRDGQSHGMPVRLTTGLEPHTISFSADGRRVAYDVYSATANVWSLPFPPSGATEAQAVQVTSGAQVIETFRPSTDGRWLYYSSNLSGNSDIYRLRLPNGEPEQLTTDPVDEFMPSVSPDGKEVVFHAWRAGSRDLFVLPLDGGPLEQVTRTPTQEAGARWSPDGQALAFNMFGTPGSIWVVRRDSTGHWGQPVERSSFGSYPWWSPDGRWLTFTSWFLGGSLMIVPADSGPARIVLDSAQYRGVTVEQPAFGDDSRTIYFKSHEPDGTAAFWSIPASGGDPTLLLRLDDPDRPSLRPEWSPGAGRMYFVVNDQQSDVWVMEVHPR